MAFLGLVAYDAWPMGVLVLCFLLGLVMTMQFLVLGVHVLGRGVWLVAGGVVERGGMAVRRLTMTGSG